MLTENFELQKAEKALLGLLLHDCKLIPSIIHELKPEFFSNDVNGIICNSILQLWDSYEPADVYTVSWHLQKTDLLSAVGGNIYLQYLLSQKGQPQHIAQYLEVITDSFIITHAKKIGLGLYKAMEQENMKPKSVITQAVKELNELYECFYHEKSKSIADLIHSSVMEKDNTPVKL